MCGRYTLTMEQEALQVALGVEGLVHPRPRFNIAPSQDVPAVLYRSTPVPEDGSDSGEGDAGGARAATLRWGLVPFWADDPSIGNRLINARSETAHQKPSFRHAFRSGRCLIPADGFFEWKKSPGGKMPFWIHLEAGGPFTFAGLCERWNPGEGGDVLETFTILTTEANDFLKPIHGRMPVILPPGDRQAWLDPTSSVEELRALLKPFPDETLAAREVSTRVNSPANDDPDCLQPPADPGDGLPLFSQSG